MSDAAKVTFDGVEVVKGYCECGDILELWLGDDECAYVLCPRCDFEVGTEDTSTNGATKCH